MKNLYILILCLMGSSVMATNYYTINLNGNIEWSTDQVTDCGCTPASGSKHDSVFVMHKYTFPVGFWGSDGAIEPTLYIDSGSDTVIFEDVVELRKIELLINSSIVIFEDDFSITGAGQNQSGVRAANFSKVYFNSDFNGNKQGSDYMLLSNSEVYFQDNSIIDQLRVAVASGANVHFGNGTRILSSWIINHPNSAAFYGNNILFDDTEFDVFTNNIVLGDNARFTNDCVVTFEKNTNMTFPSSSVFEDSEIILHPGSNIFFSSGIEVEECAINIADSAVLNVTDAQILEDSDISISGLLFCQGATVITEADMNMTSTGIIDLTAATSCDFSGSKLNKKNASNELSCGDAYNPDDNQFNIFENGAWSLGAPPNNVGMFAEIRDNYVSSNDGYITCGHLYIESDFTVDISEGMGFTVTQDFNNYGTLTVENNASLVFSQGINYHKNNGVTVVERKGLASNMKYNMWSSPVVDTFGLLVNYPNTNPCDMYVFDATIQNWKYDFAPGTETTCNGNPVVFTENDVISGGNGLMDIGRGYFLPGNNTNSIRSFEGVLNNGEVIVPIYTTNNGDKPEWGGDDWNLVGNPFPSGLDLNLFWSRNAVANQQITDGLYFWVQDATPPYDQFASYVVWNFLGNTYYYTPSGDAVGVNGLAPAAIGFWVVAADDGSGNNLHSLEFDNSMRIKPQVGANPQTRIPETEIHRLWINMQNGSNGFDQILLGTHPEATDDIDASFDAHLNYNGEPMGLAMVNNGERFTIQGFAPRLHVDTQVVELIVKVSDTTSHQIVVDSALHYLDHKRVFLIDSLKGTEEELLLKQPVSLNVDSAGLYVGRFFLKTTNSFKVSVNEVNVETAQVWASNQSLVFKTEGVKISQIEVLDLRGISVFTKKVNASNGSVNISNLATGVFVVRLTDANQNTTVKKVYVD